MLRDIIGTVGVLVPVKDLDKNRKVRTNLIANRLLTHLSQVKASECGYLLSVTKLLAIEPNGDNVCGSQHIPFTVEFRCRTFLPVHGEILTGIVHKINRLGVFLKSGPMNIVYLSTRLMSNYHYVVGGNRAYVGEDLSRIEIGVVIRYMVFAVRWSEGEQREFKVLASIDGDGLGPVSLNGLDGIDL
ncbi:DNA-directed RNA polymerase iv subunit 7 [Phtheirospermum japonicum]|uniref:DNA-directed RNA polymerase subunit n=1 Tax=Phtheirospermum japonicum TaxID=374723 RepID=A0A830CJA7_9LAMI|nr:DNA-directed RNA polymerase iv subunit 7 [Phtheirospermum japonicum]